MLLSALADPGAGGAATPTCRTDAARLACAEAWSGIDGAGSEMSPFPAPMSFDPENFDD